MNAHPLYSPTRCEFDRKLIEQLDGAGPRYTSYPTADRFGQAFGEADYRRALGQRKIGANRRPLSLYVHVPFCNTVCYYCGCNKIITKDKSRADRYLDYLEKEVDLVCRAVGSREKVAQLHFGGGTPTFLSDAQLERVMGMLKSRFDFLPEGEYSIEIDPRKVGRDTVFHLAALGFNRMSVGIQDFDPAVQAAVNRVQSEEETVEVIEAARTAGFRSVSVDLIYGLPLQTRESVAATLARVIAIGPDRVALYNYAHLPQLFMPQRRIDEAELPTPAVKLDILQDAVAALEKAGYVFIGMDHFAKPDDDLARALAEGRLQRNFQGYSTHADCDMVGLGVSSIGKVGGSYVPEGARQLLRRARRWQAAGDARLPDGRRRRAAPLGDPGADVPLLAVGAGDRGGVRHQVCRLLRRRDAQARRTGAAGLAVVRRRVPAGDPARALPDPQHRDGVRPPPAREGDPRALLEDDLTGRAGRGLSLKLFVMYPRTLSLTGFFHVPVDPARTRVRPRRHLPAPFLVAHRTDRGVPMPQTTRILLPESAIPTHWYNVVADMPNPPEPVLGADGQALSPDALSAIFPDALIEQEVSRERWIPIPQEVRELYPLWRPTALVRAHRLEAALGTPARIYYKYEGASPAGSHKLNSALPQAYYNKREGITRLTTETGAGQWGSSLSFAGGVFGIDVRVYMVRVSYQQKPFRRSMMQTWGAEVLASPSELTVSGRAALAAHPDSPGSLGLAIAEAVEEAAGRADTNYALGSVLNHVLLHQTVIGLEAKQQFEIAGDWPDMIFAPCGGGSNFGGIAFPFLADNAAGKKPCLLYTSPSPPRRS